MKRYFAGTHRSVSPETTLRAASRLARLAGVTRLADLTGLDRLNLPVFQAVRPLGRSLSVTMGKGLSVSAARVSALMEAIEFHHAETLPRAPRVDPATAFGPDLARLWSGIRVRNRVPFDPHRPRGWLPARDLASGAAAWVPREAVAFDLTTPGDPDIAQRTNGLASGNDRVEAEVAALSELIERDAEAHWMLQSAPARARTRLDLATVTDADAARLVAATEEAGIDLLVYDTGARHRVPAFLAIMLDRRDAGPAVVSPGIGGGCHPDPAIALLRAVTEAAQARAMVISGARDDIAPGVFLNTAHRTQALHIDLLTMLPPARQWSDIAGAHLPTSADDLAWLLDRVAPQPVFALDLTQPEFADLAVVKLVAPGLADIYTRVGQP